VAAVATTVLAAIASAVVVAFADSTGASIPIAGFAQLTLIFSLVGVGVGIAAVMARKARRPRATFVRTAVALTALSFVPDLTFGFDAGSAATLITLHTVAAAIVVPTLTRRLARADQARTVSLSFRQVDAISPTPLRGNPVAVVKTRTRDGRAGSRARTRARGAAPTGHDDEHPATFAFKVGQQARVTATRSAHTWPGQATSHAELSALASGDQRLASGVSRSVPSASSDIVETAAGRKPRAIIHTASTISCTARGMNIKTCAEETAPMTPYIASRSAAT
jgi:hypothetical protein